VTDVTCEPRHPLDNFYGLEMPPAVRLDLCIESVIVKRQGRAMHLARLTLFAAAFMGLTAGYAAAKPFTTAAETNLRKGPGTASESVALIPKGTTIDVDKCTDGWCSVTWNGQSGYAFAGNVMGPRLMGPRLMDPTIGGSRPRPAGGPDFAADIPGPRRPPVAGGPPLVGGPLAAFDDDDEDEDEYGPPVVRGPGLVYAPPPAPPYGSPVYDGPSWESGRGWRRW
jgi:hypothetical protein